MLVIKYNTGYLTFYNIFFWPKMTRNIVSEKREKALEMKKLKFGFHNSCHFL